MAAAKKPAKKKTTKKASPKKKAPALKPLAWDHPAALLCTWFGFGRISFAPGTWGSLGAFPVIAFIFAIFDPSHIFMALFVSAILTFFAGMWASEIYLKTTKKKDPSEIVIDEVSGQLLAVTFVTYNAGSHVTSLQVLIPYIVIFLMFRFFDIWKPWPCNYIDKNVKGALGIMLDDTFAAIYAVAMFYTIAVLMAVVMASVG